jgi:hypothetical protein
LEESDLPRGKTFVFWKSNFHLHQTNRAEKMPGRSEPT